MIDVVAEAIVQKYKSNSTLNGALTGMYFQMAPQNAVLPYCVFYFNGHSLQEIMGDADSNITEIDLQFNLFTELTDGGYHISELTEYLNDCFHWVILNIDGWDCLKMAKETLLAVTYVDDVWQSSTDYSLWIQKE